VHVFFLPLFFENTKNKQVVCNLEWLVTLSFWQEKGES
jgi:hypothetical protein